MPDNESWPELEGSRVQGIVQVFLHVGLSRHGEGRRVSAPSD